MREFFRVVQFSAPSMTSKFGKWPMPSLTAGGDPSKHVIAILIPNVVKLISGFAVHWEWKDPHSDWARSHGTASDAYNNWVSEKSRPNWVRQMLKLGPNGPLVVSERGLEPRSPCGH